MKLKDGEQPLKPMSIYLSVKSGMESLVREVGAKSYVIGQEIKLDNKNGREGPDNLSAVK